MNDLRNTLFILSLVFLMHCSEVPIEDTMSINGKICLIKNQKPFTGKVVERFMTGDLESEVHYKNGLKDGLAVYYYDNMQKEYQGHYVQGLKDGKWEYWLESGEMQTVITYDRGDVLSQSDYQDGYIISD